MGLVLSHSDFPVKGKEKNLIFSLSEKKRCWENSISLYNITGRAVWILHLLGYKGVFFSGWNAGEGKEREPPHIFLV